MSLRWLCLSLVVTAGLVGLGVAIMPVDAERRPDPGAPRVEAAAARVLGEWDRSRARAWASGDPAELRDLYVDGSSASRTDRAMLRTWTQRGLRVEGIRMQLLAVDVVASGADRLVLDVTDRLVDGVAVGSGVRLPLPDDSASTHRVTLVRESGEWRVAAVRPARSARPPRRSGHGTRSPPARARPGGG